MMEYDEPRGWNLRVKERRSYALDQLDSVIEGIRTFDVEEKLNTEKFAFDLDEILLKMDGQDFNLKYIQEYGFRKPILFEKTDGLGIKIPPEDFTIHDVRTHVGARRTVDVMDTKNQEPLEMTLSSWVKYYTNPVKDRILNVISLEFSHTALDKMVEPPDVVKEIDWVNTMWPVELISQQRDSTNNIADMKYPKVRKYVLMSVGGCYTDFHIDFGGTSVWYHILHGEKVFWLIPPTDKNLEMYEKWVLSGKQQDVFFGDLVDKCGRVHLKSGNTFMIPTGWIHAVYTPSDSLVFGGNFLHSYGISKQIRVSRIEDSTKVPQKFRYPFYAQMMWYVARRYTDCLEKNKSVILDRENETESCELNSEDKENSQAGVDDLEFGNLFDDFMVKTEEDTVKEPVKKNKPWEPINLTIFELKGLKKLVKRLRQWPEASKEVPEDFENGEELLSYLEDLLKEHSNDEPLLSVTGTNIFKQYDEYMQNERAVSKKEKPCRVYRSQSDSSQSAKVKVPKLKKVSTTPGATPDKLRKRRARCGQCEGCNRGNCEKCVYCVDMKKYGGPGKLKQSCMYRVCTNPTPAGGALSNMEMPSILGRIKRKKSDSGSERHGDESAESKTKSAKKAKKQKVDVGEDEKLESNSDASDEECKPEELVDQVKAVPFDCKVKIKKLLKQNLPKLPKLVIKIPPLVVRPGPIPDSPNVVSLRDGENHLLEQDLWLKVFQFLTQSELCVCMLVCRTWNRWIIDGDFWKNINVSEKKITSTVLEGIVRRQPLSLDLGNTNITFQQLKWLLERLPRLFDLSIEGNTVASASVLGYSVCPPLTKLNLSWCIGLKDEHMKKLLMPSKDLIVDGTPKSRLRFLRDLRLAGADITNQTLTYISSYLPHLQCLDISYCVRVSEDGITLLTGEKSICRASLKKANFSGCIGLSETKFGLEKLNSKELFVVIDKIDPSDFGD